LLLGPENPLVSISAFTAQLQKHLPPVDTIEATAKAQNGAVGSISMSFGTTYKGREYAVACEQGFVTVNLDKVTVNDKIESIEDERTGVPPEVREWGKALAAGKVNPKQSPEEALADLELLEAMLRSGEQDGQPVKLKHQVLSS
jgi:predicted dehydrogenase